MYHVSLYLILFFLVVPPPITNRPILPLWFFETFVRLYRRLGIYSSSLPLSSPSYPTPSIISLLLSSLLPDQCFLLDRGTYFAPAFWNRGAGHQAPLSIRNRLPVHGQSNPPAADSPQSAYCPTVRHPLQGCYCFLLLTGWPQFPSSNVFPLAANFGRPISHQQPSLVDHNSSLCDHVDLVLPLVQIHIFYPFFYFQAASFFYRQRRPPIKQYSRTPSSFFSSLGSEFLLFMSGALSPFLFFLPVSTTFFVRSSTNSLLCI